MGKQSFGGGLVGTAVAVAMIASSCGAQEDTAPTFQVTSPTLETTTSTAPETLEYIGLPELSAEENAMCRFVNQIGRDLVSSDELSRASSQNAENAASDRTLSEPLRVRLLRDAEIANARRFANVLSRFSEAIPLIDAIEPGPLTDQETLDRDAVDAALLVSIGKDIEATIGAVRPLNAAEREAYAERTGEEWVDLFTEAELDKVIRTVNNSKTGMGRDGEAREAMERLDDWSWRHCASGLTK